MPSVSHLTVRGFKSISALERFELGSLNVLIGANGAGKSNLLDVFRMLAAMPGRRFQVFVAREDGPEALLFRGPNHTDEIGIECAFSDSAYSASLAAVGRHLVFTRETAAGTWLGSGHYESNLEAPEIAEVNPFVRLIRETMSDWRVYHFHDTATNSRIRQAQPVRDNLQLHPSGANLAPFLRHIREKYPDNYRRIVESVRLARALLRRLPVSRRSRRARGPGVVGAGTSTTRNPSHSGNSQMGRSGSSACPPC